MKRQHLKLTDVYILKLIGGEKRKKKQSDGIFIKYKLLSQNISYKSTKNKSIASG